MSHAAERQPATAPTRLDALDGLRTLAVFLVVFFHIAVPGLSAGFIGVDVFFVLSGYLITTGLVREIQGKGRIDLVRFWTRRLRRLMPAAMLVLFVVMVWAWFWAPAYRRPALGSDIFTTVVYLANWHFMRAGSYFNADGSQSPLLHMWSLAVEEQFYLLWPLILVVTTALSRQLAKRLVPYQDQSHRRQHFINTAMLVCTGLLLVSAALLVVWYQVAGSPDRSYMGTDSKAFEPLLGAVVAMAVTRPGVEEWITWYSRRLGWACLLTMVALFPLMAGPSNFYFRGGALLFSLATAGLLLATTRDAEWVVSRGFSWAPIAYLGRISYGIYLWHWPLAVWLHTHAQFRPGRALLVVLGTVALASLSYHLMEQPILVGRWAPWFSARRTFATAGSTMLAMSLLAAPLGGTLLTPLARAVLPDPPLQRNSVMMVGDSVPQRLLPALSAAGEARGLQIGTATAGGCSPLGVHQLISPEDQDGDKCPDVRQRQQENLELLRPATVVWWSRYEIADRYQGDRLLLAGTAAFWSAQVADFNQAVDRLTKDGATLVVVLTEPAGRGMSTRCSPRTCHPFLQRMVTHDEYRTSWNKLVKLRAASDPRIRVITMDDVACTRPPRPTATYGSSLCDDTVAPGQLARPDGSHWDNALVGARVSDALLDRVREVTAK